MIRRVLSGLYCLVALRFISVPWRLPCFAALGVLVGLGLVVGKASRVTSYLSDAPEGCANCHVMNSAYASWQRSSHANVATCNDCHVPHQTLLHAYAFKARDGIYHSTIFTLRMEPQVIHISEGAIPVVEANCLRCHAETLQNVSAHNYAPGDHRCWDCHREVPHGRVHSLSSTPREMSPALPPIIEPQEPTIGQRRPRPKGQEKSHD